VEILKSRLQRIDPGLSVGLFQSRISSPTEHDVNLLSSRDDSELVILLLLKNAIQKDNYRGFVIMGQMMLIFD